MTLKPDVDPKTGKLDPPIELGGKPEFLAADGKGNVYINLVDKNEVVAVDLKARKVTARWSVAPGGARTRQESNQACKTKHKANENTRDFGAI